MIITYEVMIKNYLLKNNAHHVYKQLKRNHI